MIKTMVKLDCAVVEGGHFRIVFALTLLLEPAYLRASKDRGGGISAPLFILGLVWVRVPILFGNDLSGSS